MTFNTKFRKISKNLSDSLFITDIKIQVNTIGIKSEDERHDKTFE